MENEAITGIGEIEPGLTLILQVPDGKNLLVVALGRPIAITGANRHLIPVSPMEKRRENGEVEEINLRRILWLDSSSWIGGNYQMIKGPSWDLKDLIAEARFIIPSLPQNFQTLPHETQLEVKNLNLWIANL